ncbi:MAG: ZIP family metal transporter [Candidatus Obscuribacterales bacterium]|nr:ZIP family metal transporter [Candidatus Obscuribacterales bacterium]
MALAYAMLAALLVSIVSLIGLVTFFSGKDLHKRVSHILLALAAGAMLGNAVLHLLPHALTLEQVWITEHGVTAGHEHHDHDHDGHDHATTGGAHVHNHDHGGHGHVGMWTAFLLLGGMVSFYALDLLIRPKKGDDRKESSEGYLVAVGDGIENFLDGIVIGTSFLVSVPLGIAATVTIFLHEIPLELGDYAVMRHSGFSKMKALLTNFLSGLLSLVGVLVAYLVGSQVESFVFFATAIAAGALLYIAASILVPHVRQESQEGGGFQYFLVSLFGMALMAAILLFE